MKCMPCRFTAPVASPRPGTQRPRRAKTETPSSAFAAAGSFACARDISHQAGRRGNGARQRPYDVDSVISHFAHKCQADFHFPFGHHAHGAGAALGHFDLRLQLLGQPHLCQSFVEADAGRRAARRIRIRVLRELTPDVAVTTNMMGTFADLDYYHAWDTHVDVVAWDCYPGARSDPAHTAFCHDLMRGLKDRPFLLMEQTPSSQNWQNVNALSSRA